MKLLYKLRYSSTRIRNKFLNFRKNSEGVAAVEFALIAPVLLLLFIGTIEVSLMIAVDRKIGRTSSAIADLIAQGSFTDANSENEIRAIFGMSDRIMFPYTNRTPCIVISHVVVEREDTNNDGDIDEDDEMIARVESSIDNSTASANNDYQVPSSAQCNKPPNPEDADPNARLERNEDSIFPLPDALITDLAQFIVAEVEYDHKPIIGIVGTSGTADFSIKDGGFTISDRIYLRPRIGTIPEF